jgi:diacylglycerol kinase (ATP)
LTPLPKLIYNPTANKGGAGEHLAQVQALLEKHGFAYDLVLTTGPGHALELARQAAEAGCPLVIAAGGDGTVNEVLNGLMSAQVEVGVRPALAVLPVGRGNDFSFGMKIPQLLEEAVDALAAGQRQRIDVGRVVGGFFPQGRYFGNGIGLGFDAVVGFEAAKITWLHGAASYLAALVRTISLYAKAPVYEVLLDGEKIQQPFLMISIMNGTRMGGAFHMAPDSNPSDGQFDLCMVGQVPQIRILPVALKFISGTHTTHPAVRMARARKIAVRAVQGSIPAHADGETVCTAGQELTAEIIPGALEVVTRLTA